MIAHVARRVMVTLPTLLGILIASFFLLHMLPGDPARAVLGQRASEENVRVYRQQAGLDRPLHQQLLSYLDDLAHGEFGTSHRTSQSVASELKLRIPATMELALAAMLLATVVGVSLGILASIRPHGPLDLACLVVALVGVSIPIFWLGFLLQRLFAGELNMLPFGGRMDVTWEGFRPITGFFVIDAALYYRSPALLADVLAHLALPAFVLATVPTALIARITRATMMETLKQDYMRTAKAKGAGPASVVLKHGLRNALIPILTAVTTQFGYLLGGAVLTETIFGWPGLGRYVIESIDILDARPLQASVLFIASAFVLVNLLTDLSYSLVDPRLRRRGAP